MAESSGSQAVERSLDLLAAFRPEDPSLSLSELTLATGLTPSTARRLLKALMARGLVEQDPHSRRYRLGMQLTRLGRIAERQSELGRVAGGLMRGLVQETDGAVYLSRLVGADALYLMVVHTDGWERLTAEVGQTYPAWRTATGRVLLAERSDEELDAMIPETLPEHQGVTGITRERIRAELELARARGYATQFDEERSVVFSFAAPVFDGSGVASLALSVSGPGHSAPDAERVVPLLKSAANQLSYRIGGSTARTRYATASLTPTSPA